MKTFKKIGITGKNGYISSNLKLFLENNNEYQCDIIDLQDKRWEKSSFLGYDVIVHTAALVHQNDKNYSLMEYIKINCDLTEKVAKKAKFDKVKQFIFLSTEAVYGIVPSVNKTVIINKDTPTNPITKYGISKLKAEKLLLKLDDYKFSVIILRCPIVYGKLCKGNYNSLRKIALQSPVFPRINNKKSFLYIGNLCCCINHMIDICFKGFFSPQNNQFSSTREIVDLIKKYNGKKGYYSYFLAIIVRLFFFVPSLRKAFGNSCIDKSLSSFPDNFNYQIYSLEESIKLTEK